MATTLVTANLPGFLKPVIERQWKAEHYAGKSEYAVGLILWDIYSRQPHATTGTLMRQPSWMVDSFVRDLMAELGEPPLPPNEVVPYRFSVYIPKVLMPWVKTRATEERYRSASAHIVSLVLYDLKRRAPDPKCVPHHKIAPLLREPLFIREAVYSQLIQDFGNPARKWPKGIEGRIDELIVKQRELPLRP